MKDIKGREIKAFTNKKRSRLKETASNLTIHFI